MRVISSDDPFDGCLLSAVDLALVRRVLAPRINKTPATDQLLVELKSVSLGEGCGLGLSRTEGNHLAALIFEACSSPAVGPVLDQAVRLGSALDTYGEIDWLAVRNPRRPTTTNRQPAAPPSPPSAVPPPEPQIGVFPPAAPATPPPPYTSMPPTPPPLGGMPSVASSSAPTAPTSHEHGRTQPTQTVPAAAGPPLSPGSALPVQTAGTQVLPRRGSKRHWMGYVAAATLLVVGAIAVVAFASSRSNPQSVTAARPTTTSTRLVTSTTAPSTPVSTEVADPEPDDPPSPSQAFIDELESNGTTSELKRMIELSPGDTWDGTLLTFGQNICKDLRRGYTETAEVRRIVSAIEDSNGSSGGSAPGSTGRAAIEQLVGSSHRHLCPEAKQSTTTTTTRSTTTTEPVTTTVLRGPIVGKVENSCGLPTCKVYLRNTPFPDLSKPSDSYYLDGDDVPIACQTAGSEVRDGDTGMTSTRWYRTENGLYLSALYVVVQRAVPDC